LAGGAGAAAAGADGEGFAPGNQLVGGDGQLVLFGQLQKDLAVQRLVGPLEGDDQAEAGRQAHQLLAGVGLVQVVAGAVGEGLLDQVAAVGGGVDRDVVGAAAGAAL